MIYDAYQHKIPLCLTTRAQVLISGNTFSQYSLSSLIFSPIHITLNRKQYENLLYSQSSWYRKFTRETDAPTIDQWKVGVPLMGIITLREAVRSWPRRADFEYVV